MELEYLKLMSITTKNGDNGETSLLGGKKVQKNDPLIEAIGTIDELNAAIGITLNYVQNNEIKKNLEQIQNELFILGKDICKENTQLQVEKIEKEIEKLEQELPKQTKFILPQGNLSTTHLHLTRTICRRAERKITNCKVNTEIKKYINRLSDLLFLYARKENNTEKTVNYKL